MEKQEPYGRNWLEVSQKADIKITVFEDPINIYTVYKYEDVIGFTPRPLLLNITLSTQKHVDELIDFLKEVKPTLIWSKD